MGQELVQASTSRRSAAAWGVALLTLVALVALPAAAPAAGPYYSGGGALTGTLEYSGSGFGRFLGAANCAPQTATLKLSSPAYVVSTQDVGEYVGPLEISLSGLSQCDSHLVGSTGFNSGVVEGTNALGNQIQCDVFSGTVVRAAGAVSLVFAVQSCTIDGRASARRFIFGAAELAFVQDSSVGNPTGSTNRAALAGAMVGLP